MQMTVRGCLVKAIDGKRVVFVSGADRVLQWCPSMCVDSRLVRERRDYLVEACTVPVGVGVRWCG